jgi:hypothetical protein
MTFGTSMKAPTIRVPGDRWRINVPDMQSVMFDVTAIRIIKIAASVR